MEYREFPPPSPLAGLVRCAWTLRDDDGSANATAAADAPAHPALPDGSPELIFNFGAPFEQITAGRDVVRQPTAFLVGQITRPMVVRPTGRVDLLAVRFESHGASILHTNMQELTDRWAAVETLIGGELPAIASRLAAAATPGERWQRLSECLLAHARRSPTPDPRVAAAVNEIRRTHGGIGLDAMARALGVAPRTLQRLFARQVGVSPKMLARMVRFQRVFGAWRDDPGSLARVAAECGYFDQSHMVRDFRDFAGAPPAGLLAALPMFTGFFVA